MAKKSNEAKVIGPVGSDPKGMSDWEHEDNARTLMRAGEILQDPKKMKGAHKHMKKQKKAMRSVQDLMEYNNQKYGPKAMDDHDGDE